MVEREDWEGVLKIVRCMKSWSLHEEVQEKVSRPGGRLFLARNARSHIIINHHHHRSSSSPSSFFVSHSSFSIIHQGCLEISNLCVNHYHKELLREAGAIEAVLQAMAYYPESLKVQLAGCQAITHLASDDKSRIRLCKSGAGAVLVQSLTFFSKDRVSVDHDGRGD